MLLENGQWWNDSSPNSIELVIRVRARSGKLQVSWYDADQSSPIATVDPKSPLGVKPSSSLAKFGKPTP